MRNFLLAVVGAALFTTSASANINPTFVSDVAGVYTYTLAVDSSENVLTGDKFCFGGIQGLTGAAAAAGWSFATSAGGCGTILAGAPLNTSGASVVYTYTASTTIVGAASLGTFSFTSTDVTLGSLNDPYGAQAHLNAAGGGGTSANQGEVNGPVATTTVPEPSSILLLGSFLFLGGRGLRRRFAKS